MAIALLDRYSRLCLGLLLEFEDLSLLVLGKFLDALGPLYEKLAK